jgi:hypothetical protein
VVVLVVSGQPFSSGKRSAQECRAIIRTAGSRQLPQHYAVQRLRGGKILQKIYIYSTGTGNFNMYMYRFTIFVNSVADPDTVSGVFFLPPGSGSGMNFSGSRIFLTLTKTKKVSLHSTFHVGSGMKNVWIRDKTSRIRNTGLKQNLLPEHLTLGSSFFCFGSRILFS